MRQFLTTTITLLLTSCVLLAQSPYMFNYQAVVRNGDGSILPGANVPLQITLRQGSASGNNIYQERHNAFTNEFGLVNIAVGDPDAVLNGSIDNINWQNGPFFIQVEMLPPGASNYSDMGTTQLLTVPYAMHASTVADKNDADANPSNELQTISKSGVTVTLSDGGGTFNVNDNDASASNELQTLSVSGNTLSLSDGGGSVSIPVNSLWTQNGGSNIYYAPGNVGVGTPSPTHTLHLDGGDSDAALRIEGSGTYGSGGRFNFGDANYVYIEEDTDDNLKIYGSGGIDISTGGDLEVTNGTLFVDESIYSDVAIRVRNSSNTTKVSITRDSGGSGFLETDGPNGQRNTAIGSAAVNNNGGWIGVFDATGQSKAGMFINADNEGIFFKDENSFRMDHPTDPEKEIWYCSIEGPEAAAYERGTAQLTNGEAQINFSEHFELVANPTTMTVILTPNSADSEGLAVVEKTTIGFSVKELRGGTGNYGFDWEVKCVRRGHEDYRVIRDKREMQMLIGEVEETEESIPPKNKQ